MEEITDRLNPSIEKKLKDNRTLLIDKNKLSLFGGGKNKIDKQNKSGKLTARERINILFDVDSFSELDRFRVHRCIDFKINKFKILGDGVITGFGRVNGRKVFAYAQDFTVFGGTLSEVHSQKICKIYDMAMKVGAPIIGLIDSGGARIQEGVTSLAGYGNIFRRNSLSSGVIPQISVIMGPSAGGAVYSPALTDFIFMVENSSYMFLTGPSVVKTVTGEDVTMEDLGGAYIHNSKSGVSHFSYSSEEETIEHVKCLLSYLPSNNTEDSPLMATNDSQSRKINEIINIIPSDHQKSYDVREVIKLIVDDYDFMEIQSSFAKNIVIAFSRINGQVVGIVANQPNFLAGALDINASDKSSRFIRFCDCFNIPIITLVDVPGFLPGTSQEFGGIIRHGAKLLYSYSEATVPKITVILRKAYGGAYCVMGSKELRTDLNIALPDAEIAVMGADSAVNLLMRKEISMSRDKEKYLKKLKKEYSKNFQNPYKAAELGYIDEIIFPEDIRIRLSESLAMLKNKRDYMPQKKHDNMPF